MPLPYPSQRRTGVQLVTVDLLNTPQSTRPVIAGDAYSELVFDPPDSPFLWLIDRITVGHTSTQPTAAFVFVGDANAQNLRDSTTAGNADVADYAAGIFVPPSMPLRVRWVAPAGLSVGSVGTANVQYRLMQRNV